MFVYQAHVAQTRAKTNVKPMQQESSFSQDISSWIFFLPHQCKTPKKGEKIKWRYVTSEVRLPSFPPMKYAILPQHGIFSLHTMFEGLWQHEMAIPTPMVRPLNSIVMAFGSYVKWPEILLWS
jgi:hypothetical protein